jgi:hypothetical protein
MYSREYWKDRATDQLGNVIQQGTLQDQAHYNNMETGIDDENIAGKIMLIKRIQEGYENEAEYHDVTLSMNAGMAWPFNNKETTVALTTSRESTDYNVDIYVLDYDGGHLGNIRVMDRALNGFKLIHDGSATTVNVRIKVTGGMSRDK